MCVQTEVNKFDLKKQLFILDDVNKVQYFIDESVHINHVNSGQNPFTYPLRYAIFWYSRGTSGKFKLNQFEIYVIFNVQIY